MTLHSDKQDTIVSLTLTIGSCDAANASISVYSYQKDIPRSDHAVLHRDFLSLLSLLHGAVTKLSLALKPSSPTYNASLTPLKDISDHISALSHCVGLFEQRHGITLIQEIASVARDIIESIRSLLQTFLDIERGDTRTSSGQAGDEYMVRTGAVHDIINRARSPDGISTDNVAAVRKKWAQDYDSLNDGLREINEMIEEASADVQAKDISDDDGWTELGFHFSKKMDVNELERAKKVHAILRLSTLLHKRVIQDILSLPLHASLDYFIQQLDALPHQSSALLTATDELISTIYTPQNSSDIATELALFQNVVQRLRSLILVFIPESTLAEQMQGVNIHDRAVPGRQGSRKWFDACFDQIQKTAQALRSSLEQSGER